MTAAARIGSVGVKHAATARDERKFNPGIKAYMSAAEMNQPCIHFSLFYYLIFRLKSTQVITGISKNARLLQ